MGTRRCFWYDYKISIDKEYGYFLNVLQGEMEIMDYELAGQENEINIIQSGG